MGMELSDLFFPGQSPYHNMYVAGLKGIPLNEVLNYLKLCGIAPREKDIKNWENGYFKRYLNSTNFSINSIEPSYHNADRSFFTLKFESLNIFPLGWKGSSKRFFPCSQDNKPLCKWGYKADNMPALYTYADAKALSPVGWVGQNMMYQPFIVLDIDGVGHGETDEMVIEFGNYFANKTWKMEDPAKPGSFHLYFSTDRIVPLRHFPYAKLDLMGNAVNAAVYLKNKKYNGLPMKKLDSTIWGCIQEYTKFRYERTYK